MSEKSFTEKLIHIQKELKAPKGQYNSFGKYKYRSAEDILEAVKPLNAEQGLLLTLSDEPVLVGNWNYIKATATITSGTESHVVTAFARESETKKGMDHSQITGTASSYARKYALNGLYLIDDTKDADTDEYQKQNKQQGNQQQNNQQPQKASPKQLNFIDKLIKEKETEKLTWVVLYDGLKNRMNTDVEMENWTSQQARQAIEILQGDKK